MPRLAPGQPPPSRELLDFLGQLLHKDALQRLDVAAAMRWVLGCRLAVGGWLEVGGLKLAVGGEAGHGQGNRGRQLGPLGPFAGVWRFVIRLC